MNATTKLSIAGQLVTAKSVRDADGWEDGRGFEFIEAATGETFNRCRYMAPASRRSGGRKRWRTRLRSTVFFRPRQNLRRGCRWKPCGDLLSSSEIDAIVLVRALVDDRPRHGSGIRPCLRDYRTMALQTARLETELPLPSRLGPRRDAIKDLVPKLLAWPGVLFADRPKAVDGVIASRRGLDLVDAVPLINARRCASTLNFGQVCAWHGKTISGPCATQEPQTAGNIAL